MRRLIRNRRTQEFLGIDGKWTRDHAAARKFPDTLSLIQCALSLPEPDLDYLLMEQDTPSPYDLSVPIKPISPEEPPAP